MQQDIDTVFNYCEKDKAFFSSNEQKWIARIQKLARLYPDDVHIIALPKDNYGVIYAQLPPSWLFVGPKRKSGMTDEQKLVASERMKQMNKLRWSND